MAEAMGKTVRWGILGAGIIASKMADALSQDNDSTLVAVASKSAERAKRFAAEYAVPKALSYEQLAANPDIDIVYIATTHNYHYENAKMILERGKPVLMEKAFTINADQAAGLINLARRKGLFLMEAHWVRFLPSLIRLRQILAAGTIGEVLQVNLNFGGYVPAKFKDRLEDPFLGGGATLDKGVYPINFLCYMLNETPDRIHSMCRLSESGVDETAAYQLGFPSGALAQVSTSYALKLLDRAELFGSKGYIEFPDFPVGENFTLHLHGGSNDVSSREDITEENPGNGFIYQVRECVRCLREGRKESSVMPLDETLAIMGVMDQMRDQWGLRYPFEGQ